MELVVRDGKNGMLLLCRKRICKQPVAQPADVHWPRRGKLLPEATV